jgi:tetratricopeptide (TPR) repeat protein
LSLLAFWYTQKQNIKSEWAMNADEISQLVAFADNLVYEKTGQHLKPVEKDILKQTLEDKGYKQFKCDNPNNDYIKKNPAFHLWRKLSKVTGEKVTKKTVKRILERLQEATSEPCLESLETERSDRNVSPDAVVEVNESLESGRSQDEDSPYQPLVLASQNTTDSSTSTWHNFTNFIKPGVPLLLSAAFIGSGFGLSWLANWYGVTNHLAGELPKAQAGYDWALKLNPGSPSGHYNLGNLYEDQQNYHAAREQYSKAMQDDFVAASAYNNKARLLIVQDNKPAAAIDLLQKALPLAKDKIVKSDIHKNMGWALLKQRRYEEAETHLRTAIELTRSQASSYCLLAQIVDRRGDKKAALVQWQQCLGYASMYNKDEAIWIGMARQRMNNATAAVTLKGAAIQTKSAKAD